MRNNTIAFFAVIAALAAASPVMAGSWSENIALCADAAQEQGLIGDGEVSAKFLRAYGGATKTITLELTSQSGESIEAICKIRRGKVSDIRLAV